MSSREIRLMRPLILLCLGLQQACTFSVPQLDSVASLLKSISLSEKQRSEQSAATWLASVGGSGAVLRPYASENGLTVFANAEGDAIAFDGWTIRSVIGFGLDGPSSINGKEGKRTILVNGQVTSTECELWRLTGLVWSQICANGLGKIVLDQKGNIEYIAMSLGETLGIVTLRVVK